MEDYKFWLVRDSYNTLSEDMSAKLSSLRLGEEEKESDRVTTGFLDAWEKYASTKTWLLRDTTTGCTDDEEPRDHEMALAEEEEDYSQWLCVSSSGGRPKRTPSVPKGASSYQAWLYKRSLSGSFNTVPSVFGNVLNSPSSQWLKDTPNAPPPDYITHDLSQWLSPAKEPKPLCSEPQGDPLGLMALRAFHDNVTWIQSSIPKEQASKLSQHRFPPFEKMATESYQVWLAKEGPTTSGSDQKGSEEAPWSDWLIPSSTSQLSAKMEDVNQWLLTQPYNDQESEASLATVDSEYDMMEDCM